MVSSCSYNAASVTKNPEKLSETETSPPGRENKASATKGHVDEPDVQAANRGIIIR
ncbi:hypothetical protein HOLleu_00008 [Holothuria leucospilota]|uniref:Uncharacterized protein n=1 Tax=Holothuria leucospilota TaxID=206669 RepID=A0A9Q1CNZ0_HOLLE|nr:hypothetical protein HOLleu_00008 [Holothuria leucospilota]